MPRSRGSEVSQRPSPRGPPHLRTSSSYSDPTHHRPIAERSTKIGDRCSPRGSLSDPVNQKKLGTRIADLESQLGQAQNELKNLKHQLASAEAAKKEVQEKLEKKTKKPVVSEKVKVKVKGKNPQKGTRELNKKDINTSDKAEDDDHPEDETDVFEVPIEKLAIEPKSETTQVKEDTSPTEQEKSTLRELAAKDDDDIEALRAKLEEKGKEAELLSRENESLKTQLSEAASKISSAQAKEEGMALKLSQLLEELDTSKTNAARVNEQLKFMEESKETLEAEMKKIRVQTDQWRKAADAAAAVLSGDTDMLGRIPDRCGSMDKHFAAGYGGFMGSPSDDIDDGFGTGKRKGSGIKMFGDLWRKKGQK